MKDNNNNNPLDKQVGGEHYKSMPIQPIEIRHMLKLDGTQSDILTYVLRHKFKNGIEDLNKAIHHCQLALYDYRFTFLFPRTLTPEESAILSVICKINEYDDDTAEFIQKVVQKDYGWLETEIEFIKKSEYNKK